MVDIEPDPWANPRLIGRDDWPEPRLLEPRVEPVFWPAVGAFLARVPRATLAGVACLFGRSP
jgi:hypothetical protein